MRRRVVIIGGGISGLAAAHHLHERSPETEIVLLEAGHRLGGVIKTKKRDGFLVESAADNFITTSPTAVQLCQRVGLGEDLIGTNKTGRGAMVVRDGRLEPIPAGFMVMAPSRAWPLVSTRILSPLGKLRAACEFFVSKGKGEDESLQSFTCRRFGREIFERIVQPLVGGIYTADPERLSVAATMPRFLKMEQEHGSLTRAMLAQRKSHATKRESGGGARYSQFMALRGGMSSLVDALAKKLPAGTIRLNAPVCSIVRRKSRWSIQLAQGKPGWMEADGVIVAAPASRAAGMLATLDAEIANELGGIPYASCGVVSLAFRREQIGHPLSSFGFVVPLIENAHILSCSFSSMKYEGRAPEGTVLFRVFIGGARQAGLLRLSNVELMELAHWELDRFLDIKGEPIMRDITRQTHAMPQYHVGHCQRVEKIKQRLEQFPTIALAGSSLSGVGIPGCIESGEEAAVRVISALARSKPAKAQPLCN